VRRARPLREIDLGPLDAVIERSADVLYARSPYPLTAYDTKVTDWLDLWAWRAPQRIFLAERDAKGNWRGLTYRQARAQVRSVAEALLGRGLGPERPLVILSGNSIAHAQIGLAALYVGIPYAPISPAYALPSRDFAALKRIVELLNPGLVFVENGRLFAEAMAATMPESIEIFAAAEPGPRADHLATILATPETPAVDAAHRAVGPDTIAKLMLTSGSTAQPKAVITTQRMLCANQEMIASCLRFLRDEPPVLVDWLPWSHSFGGNQNFNLVLCHGGTLYIDAGNPTHEGIATTLANLRDVAPTLYFNVPRGFETLLSHLACDKALAKNFFSRLKLNFFAGASMARHCLESLAAIAAESCGERILSMSGYGATESSPAALFSNDSIRDAAALPLPGTELKLVPHGEKREARIRGPHVTPGYWRQPHLTRRAFDEEGYYRLGDALRLAETRRPGFHFDGRIDEDFKLATGVWVSVGPLREKFVGAFAPYVNDLAIAGPGEANLAALIFPDIEACRALADLSPCAAPAEVLRHPAVLKKFAALLHGFCEASPGSSRRIARLALMPDPPSSETGELTEKGTLNQTAVLANRAALVRDLYGGRAVSAVDSEPYERRARSSTG
jgi:feruloyl-CoA synthase